MDITVECLKILVCALVLGGLFFGGIRLCRRLEGTFSEVTPEEAETLSRSFDDSATL